MTHVPPLEAGVPLPSASRSVAPSNVEVSGTGDTVIVSLWGSLDDATGRSLVDTAEAAAATAPRRLDIDVRGLRSFTREGAAALARCRGLGANLPEGLHYRTGRGAGREALLAAYAARSEKT
ncbi:hypothetical protein BH24ACT3_BH24ACT3_19200 [soil metagenome]